MSEEQEKQPVVSVESMSLAEFNQLVKETNTQMEINVLSQQIRELQTNPHSDPASRNNWIQAQLMLSAKSLEIRGQPNINQNIINGLAGSDPSMPGPFEAHSEEDQERINAGFDAQRKRYDDRRAKHKAQVQSFEDWRATAEKIEQGPDAFMPAPDDAA